MTKKVLCPSCGVWHAIEDEPKAGLFENRVRRPFRTDALMPTMPQQQVYRETPINLPTLPSHVYVPLYQSLIDGFFAFPIGVLGSLTLAIVVDNALPEFEFTNWGLALAGFGGGITISFLVAGRKWPIHLGLVNGLLWVAEEIFQADFDGDEEIGEPAPMPNRVEVEIQEKGIPREIDTLDISLGKLQRLARLILIDKEGFSERTAAKAGIGREEEWKPFRDKLIARRWAKWKHPTEPRQGVDLTPKGEAILEAILGGDMGQINVLGTHPRTPTQGSNYERFEHIER